MNEIEDFPCSLCPRYSFHCYKLLRKFCKFQRLFSGEIDGLQGWNKLRTVTSKYKPATWVNKKYPPSLERKEQAILAV